MSPMAPAGVRLVCHPDDPTPQWFLPALLDHLVRAGHAVQVVARADDASDEDATDADVDVVHAFGWVAGRARLRSLSTIPWIFSPPMTDDEDHADCDSSRSWLCGTSHHRGRARAAHRPSDPG